MAPGGDAGGGEPDGVLLHRLGVITPPPECRISRSPVYPASSGAAQLLDVAADERAQDGVGDRGREALVLEELGQDLAEVETRTSGSASVRISAQRRSLAGWRRR